MATLVNKTSKLAERLAHIAKGVTDEPQVKVGFLSEATYPDGTSVAMVAAVNEFGAPSRGQPPRPFFRLMVAQHRHEWPSAIGKVYKATDFNAQKTLDQMGQLIKGELQQSIRDLTEPPLAPSTVARKQFDKPLIDTGHMLNSVDYEVIM